MSTAYCYLNPIKHRKNLTILSDAQTSSLILEEKNVRVLNFITKTNQTGKCLQGSVLCAGTINSPQLLELPASDAPTF